MTKKARVRTTGRTRPEKKTAVPEPSPVAPDSPSEPRGVRAVVGVGASAGGLEAFSSLLKHLPDDTGMAFVLLQHLDPSHESKLAEILAGMTTLPVVRIEAGTSLKPDTVFVAPARFDIRLESDVFQLADKKRRSPGTETQIDEFFRSLAQGYGARAIGIVLSGTLSDGALGLGFIKSEGGVTFAQDTATAAFPSMPRAAVAAGHVDMVLPPDRIARELHRIVRHPYVREVGAETASDEFEDPPAGKRLLQLLRSSTGVDFASYRSSTFRRRVHRRMALKRIVSLAKYVDFLRANPLEVQALYDDILITVTKFFRDADVFESLRSDVFPEILRDRPENQAIRIWVPGCSSGEETYSIAITLLEAMDERDLRTPVQIFSTDISDRALDRAREGEYLESSLVDVSPERLKRFFTKVPNGFKIAKHVREACIFARHNVVADPPFSSLDLLSCRNLLIYFEPALQEKVFPHFHYALRPGGFLLLGRAESLGKFSEMFQAVDRTGRIFLKAGASSAAEKALSSSVRRPAPQLARAYEETADEPAPMRARDLSDLADRLVLDRFAPAGVLVNENYEIVTFRGKTAAYLEPAEGSASLNVFKMAREGLVAPLRVALMAATKTVAPVRREGVRVRADGVTRVLDLEAIPIPQGHGAAHHYLVVFEDRGSEPGPGAAKGSHPDSHRERARSLEQELRSTKDYLQSIVEAQESSNEELKSANEEILSANEELQSTNEELQTAKEELQSTNEELTTLNEELHVRNAELADAHNDLANIFGINLPIVMISGSGLVRRATPSAQRIFNLDPRDVGRRFAEFRSRLNVDVAELVDQVMETMQTADREVQDEAGTWYSLRVMPYRTAENRIDGTLVALFDTRTGEQVTRSQDYASALLETMREALLVLDEELRVRSANRAFYARTRLAPKDVEGKSLSQLWRLPERAPDLVYLLGRVLSEHEPLVNHELELDLDTLGRRFLIVNAKRMQPVGEPRPYILLALEDVTERKWAEAGLRASELRYRLLFETAREGIWLLGDKGKVLDANPFLLELLGARRDEVVGIESWCWYADPEAARARFAELRRRGFSFDPELPMRRTSGEEVRIEAVSNVYVVGVSAVVQCNMRDITDRARLQAQVRQMQKLDSIGTLAGGIAHDFNNILNIISAHTTVLERKGAAGDGGKQGESAKAIEQAVRRGAGVVKQLLTFARRTDTAFEPLDVNALVDEVRKMVVETFPKTVQLRVETSSDLPRILGDPNQIHQALLNLLVNARDAMPDGGTITLRTLGVSGETLRRRLETATADEYVAIEVADQGQGMTEETRKRLFEPFFTTKENGKGVGMGLAVVYGVVQAHQGTIDVESAMGKGSFFTLYFPVPSAVERAAEEALTPRSREGPVGEMAAAGGEGDGDGSGKTVLFVEDEELLQSAIRSLLEEQGYRVLSATDGLEAVEVHAARKSEIDAVIVDLGLPRLDGWEAFLRMKKANPNLKAIIASGNLDAEKRSRMRREGIQATLRKPYGAREIMNALRQVLES